MVMHVRYENVELRWVKDCKWYPEEGGRSSVRGYEMGFAEELGAEQGSEDGASILCRQEKPTWGPLIN